MSNSNRVVNWNPIIRHIISIRVQQKGKNYFLQRKHKVLYYYSPGSACQRSHTAIDTSNRVGSLSHNAQVIGRCTLQHKPISCPKSYLKLAAFQVIQYAIRRIAFNTQSREPKSIVVLSSHRMVQAEATCLSL